MTTRMQRILTGWTYVRAVYTLLGGIILIQSALDVQWIGVLFGIYFFSMGVFGFGCAAGHCQTTQHQDNKTQNENGNQSSIDFDTIK